MRIEKRLLNAEEEISMAIEAVAKKENLNQIEIMKILISRAGVYAASHSDSERCATQVI